MSAGKRGHEDAPKKIDQPVISEERRSWMQTPESEENVALAQGRVWEIDQGAETEAVLENDETLDRLLRAISDTDVAKLLMPAADGQPHAPAHAESPRAPLPTPGVGVQPCAEKAQRAPAAAPARTFMAQTPSAPLRSAAATQPSDPAPPESASIIEKEKKQYRLLRAISEGVHLGGEIPASNPQFRHFVQTSPEAASAPLMPPATAPQHRRAGASPRTTEAATRAAIPQVPTPPQPVAVGEPAPAIIAPRPATPPQDRSRESTIPVRCDSEINDLGAKLGRTTKRTGQALWQISARLKNRIEAGAAFVLESTDAARSRRSTGLGDCARETQGAPDIENMSQARPQPPAGLKKWFDPRRSSRLTEPPAVAYCWTADTPDAVEIADISSGGVHLLTEVRWPQGGLLSMTLQRTDKARGAPESWIVIGFIVTRLCNDGVAGTFIPSTHGLAGFIPNHLENCADDKTLKRFVRDLAATGH